MYLLTSTLASKEAAQPQFDAHCAWLHEYNRKGIFVASGPRDDGLGGVIIVHDISEAELARIIDEDPYIKANLAKYTIVKMKFRLTGEGFEKLGITP